MKTIKPFSDTVFLNIHDPGLLAENLALHNKVAELEEKLKHHRRVESAFHGVYTKRNKK